VLGLIVSYWRSPTSLSMVKHGKDQDYVLDLGSLFLDAPVSTTLNLYLT